VEVEVEIPNLETLEDLVVEQDQMKVLLEELVIRLPQVHLKVLLVETQLQVQLLHLM
jgi:hypothetical protein